VLKGGGTEDLGGGKQVHVFNKGKEMGGICQNDESISNTEEHKSGGGVDLKNRIRGVKKRGKTSHWIGGMEGVTPTRRVK